MADHDVLDAMFLDTVKARALETDGTYRRRRPSRGEQPFRAQVRLGEAARREGGAGRRRG